MAANSEIKHQHLGDAVGGGSGWFLKSFPNSLSSHMIRGKWSERRRRRFALPTSVLRYDGQFPAQPTGHGPRGPRSDM